MQTKEWRQETSPQRGVEAWNEECTMCGSGKEIKHISQYNLA